MSRRRRSRAFRPLRHAIELAAARIAIAFICALPENAALSVGAWLGRASGLVLRRRNRVALANLRLVFPGCDDTELRLISRESLAEMGRCAVDWARIANASADEIRHRVEIVGIEHLVAAAAGGKGAFGATLHYGSWELIPAAFRAHLPDLPVAVVGRELRNAGLYRMIVSRRERDGTLIVPQEARAVLRALRAGRVVGVLVDQYATARKGGVLVPFLGIEAWSNAGPALLSLRTGAPIVPAHIHRIAGGRHRIVLEPAIKPPATGDREADIIELTTRLAEVLGRVVREEPAPWLWSHRRFRHSPGIPEDLYEGKKR